MKFAGYLWAKMVRKARGVAVRGSSLGRGSKVEAGSSFINSTMGRYSFCGYDCDIVETDIGNFCSIANYVAMGGGRHPVEWVGTSPAFYEGRDSIAKKFSAFPRAVPERIIIGSDVWIGYRAIIIQGVKIGHGAVVGAGSVVTREVAPYSIVAGTPARHIRYRFDEKQCADLLASRWWDRDDDVLARCAREIRTPVRFLELLSQCE